MYAKKTLGSSLIQSAKYCGLAALALIFAVALLWGFAHI